MGELLLRHPLMFKSKKNGRECHQLLTAKWVEEEDKSIQLYIEKLFQEGIDDDDSRFVELKRSVTCNQWTSPSPYSYYI